MDTVLSIILQISEILFQPVIFKTFLGSLIGVSILVIFVFIRQAAKQSRQEKEEKERLTQSWQKQLTEYEAKNSGHLTLIDSLKLQLDTQAHQIESLNKIKEEELGGKEAALRQKEEALRNEIAAKEKILLEIRNVQSQLGTLKIQLDAKEKEISLVNKLKQDFAASEETCKKETSEKEKALREAQSTKESAEKLTAELNSTQEMYQGLKEQYEDLERHIDTLNQSLALEKTLHERLKEEHSKCVGHGSA